MNVKFRTDWDRNQLLVEIKRVDLDDSWFDEYRDEEFEIIADEQPYSASFKRIPVFKLSYYPRSSTKSTVFLPVITLEEVE